MVHIGAICIRIFQHIQHRSLLPIRKWLVDTEVTGSGTNGGSHLFGFEI